MTCRPRRFPTLHAPVRKVNVIDRRTFSRILGIGTAGVSLPTLPTISASASASPSPGASGPGTHTSFGPLKQIRAGELNMGYAEAGPAHGPAVVLLHGWPYDIHSYVDVAPRLAAAGYRVMVPVPARSRHHTVPVGQDVPQRPAVGDRARHHRAHGRPEDREGDPRRLRLGSADGRHHRGALAGALQGPGLRERLSHHQP